MISSLPLCLLPKADKYVTNSLPPPKKKKKKSISCCSIVYSSIQRVQKDNYQLSILERTMRKMHKHVHFTGSKAI